MAIRLSDLAVVHVPVFVAVPVFLHMSVIVMMMVPAAVGVAVGVAGAVGVDMLMSIGDCPPCRRSRKCRTSVDLLEFHLLYVQFLARGCACFAASRKDKE